MRAPSASASITAPMLVPWRSLDWFGLASGAILAAGVLAIYGRTFSVPLLFDDASSIADNGSIRHLWPIGPVLSPPEGAGVGGRPLLNLSFALNYAVGGTSVFGYHLVNLFIHVLAGWTLFDLVRRTLRRPPLAAHFGSAAPALALAIAAVWTWHPVQTESVTYLSQRAESLMGLCYLLTLYCFLRGAETGNKFHRGGWLCLAVMACMAGAMTKEVMATAPLLVVLYDRTFISGSFAGAWRRHWLVFLALGATWIPLGALMVNLPHRGVGFGGGVTWWGYGLNECRVVTKYFLLAFWPQPLVFDYGPELAAPLSGIWAYVLVVAALLAATVVALWRAPGIGFLPAAYLLIVAPTSSVIPILWQPMAESRLYLPLAALVSGAVVGTFVLAARRSLAAFALIAIGLGLVAALRNGAYTSSLTLWRDTVAKRPANPRAHNYYGFELARVPGRLEDAVAEYQEALRLRPDFPEAHNNLGNAWERTPGRGNDAVGEFETAVRLKPSLAEGHYNLGTILGRMPGRSEDAIREFEEAVRLKPDFAEAHYNLGTILEKLPGRLSDAVTQYREAVRLRPDYVEAHCNLGNVLAAAGRIDEAIRHYEEAIRRQPDYGEAHFNLGNVLKKVPGRQAEAITQYEEALRLLPDYAEAHNNLGNALNAAGQTGDAIREYETTLRLKPDFVPAHLNLAIALLGIPDRAAEAMAHLHAVLQLQPDNEHARQIMARLNATRPERN